MTEKSLSTKDPAEGPALNHFLDLMAAELVGADDAQRRALVARFTALALPLVRRRLIDRLVTLVTGQRKEEVRRRAAASLVDLGEAAFPAVCCHLRRARRERPQIELVGVLAEIGRTLPPEKLLSIHVYLELVLARAATPAVIDAVGAAFVKLHPTEGLD